MEIIPGSNSMQHEDPGVKALSACMTTFEKLKSCSDRCEKEIWIDESISVETKEQENEKEHTCTKGDLRWFSECILECIYNNGDWNIVIHPE